MVNAENVLVWLLAALIVIFSLAFGLWVLSSMF